jgi:hypothetical protein
MRGFASVVVLAAALAGSCASPYDPGSGTRTPPQQMAFDGPPPFTYGGQGGHAGPHTGEGGQPDPGSGGEDGLSGVDAEAAPEDAAQPVDGAQPVDAPIKRDTRADAPTTVPAPDAPVVRPDAPVVRPDVTTIVLDVSGVSARGVMMVTGYGGFAFPFNPTIARRTLTTVGPGTIVNLASKNNITCHASSAEAIKFISSMPVTSLGSATVVEFRVDMPLYIAGDLNEHLPSEFCVGYRRAGVWTWQPMAMFAFLQRDPLHLQLGRALLVASVGPQPAGAPGVDALGVLAEGGAVVRTIEIDILKH